MVVAGSQPGNVSSGLLLGKTQTREGVQGKKNVISRSSQAGLVPGDKISSSRAIGKAGEIVRDKFRIAMKSGGHEVEDNVVKKSAAQQEVADAGLYQPFPASPIGSDCEITSDSYNTTKAQLEAGVVRSAPNNESASGSRHGSDSHDESTSESSWSGRGSDTDSDGSSSGSSASKEDEDIDI